jgi:hypothetical protein
MQHRVLSPQPVMFVANRAHDEKLTHHTTGRNTNSNRKINRRTVNSYWDLMEAKEDITERKGDITDIDAGQFDR